MARKLYVDTSTNRFVQGIDNGTTASFGSLFQNDTLDVELYFLQQNRTGATVYEPLNWANKSVKLHIGQAPPSSVTAYIVANSWTNLSSTVSVAVSRTITGSTNSNEVQKITFTPEAFEGTFAITIPNRTLTLTSVSGGLFTTSDNHGLTIFEPFTITGTTAPTGFSNGTSLFVAQVVSSKQFYANSAPTTSVVTAYSATSAGNLYTLTATTKLLPARSTALEVEQALDALPCIGVDNVSVYAIPGSEYRLGFSGSKSQTTFPLATVAASLTPIYGKSATLDFATVELANAISASASIGATIEIEASEGATTETLLQQSVTINNDIIGNASPVPVNPNIANSFLMSDGLGGTWAVTVDSNGVLTSSKV